MRERMILLYSQGNATIQVKNLTTARQRGEKPIIKKERTSRHLTFLAASHFDYQEVTNI
jgi:hypothetical protein